MNVKQKLEVTDRVIVKLAEIRQIIYEIHDEFNPDEFEELAVLIVGLDRSNEEALQFCLRF